MLVPFGKGPTELTGPIIDGYVLRQSFISKDSFLRSVRVRFSTYKRQNVGTITAEIINSHNESIARAGVVSADLIDNKKYEFRFNVHLTPGAVYEFRIKTLHCRSAQSVTAHYSNRRESGHLFVSGRLCRGKELVCDFEYAGKSPITEVSTEEIARRDDEISSFLKEQNDLLSIIILSKNNLELIEKCVKAIQDNVEYEPYEVIIGDTGTTDEHVLGFYETLPKNFKVVYGLEYHFSKTNNLLAREYANGGYFLFLNNDVFLGEKVVNSMMDYARIFTVGVVGNRLLKEWGTICHDGQLMFTGEGELIGPGHVNINRMPGSVSNSDAITDGTTAACALIRKDTFFRMDGFDEEYQDIYQDCDLCLKLRRAGYHSITVRKVSSIHLGSSTRGKTVIDNPKAKEDLKLFNGRWKSMGTHSGVTFSFVTCCNAPDAYLNMLKSLPDRHSEFAEMVPVLNHDNRFTVTEALNIGGSLTRGKHNIYCHQDVLFGDGWMGHVVTEMETLGESGIVGFEGVKHGGGPASCLNVNGNIECQTVDELCLIVPECRFFFDESFKFHYYGADICMQALNEGRRNHVIGAPLKHLSR